MLREKYPPAGAEATPPKIIPVPATRDIRFDRSDAVLDWFPHPVPRFTDDFSLDVYEEWVDLTEAPLVLMLWVLRQDAESEPIFRMLANAFQKGVASISSSMSDLASRYSISETVAREFFARHMYGLTHEHLDAIDTLFRVAFSYGMLGDIPDIQFLDPTE